MYLYGRWPMLLTAAARIVAIAAMVLVVLYAPAMAAGTSSIADFTFIHTSDEHFPSVESPKTIAEMVNPNGFVMKPYKVTALPAAFAIETGDEAEFGPIRGAWDAIKSAYDTAKLQHYYTLGNHDCTWHSLTVDMRKDFGGTCYSFDRFGCHFVMLDTAGLEDPRPIVYPEQLDWLKKDLAKVGPDTPIFIGFHHPLDCGEFSSTYETDRLVDVLRPYNVVEVMVGHGHQAKYQNYDGLNMVQGGSGNDNAKGFQVNSVLNGVLRVAFKKQGEAEASKKMFEMSLTPPAKRYPAITIESPRERAVFTSEVPVKAWVRLGPGEVKSAYAEVDGNNKSDLGVKPGGSYEGTYYTTGLLPGAHWMKVSFVTNDGATYHRSTRFYVDSPGAHKVLWRADMGSASKSTVAFSAGAVYVGAYDGYMRAYSRRNGALRWQYKTGGAITCEALLLDGKLFFTSEDSNLYCVSADKGKLIWKFAADDAAYSSPVSDGKSIYFGTASGAFYSVDAVKGTQNWKNTEATYTIELKPFLADGRIYYGAWDTYEYCLNTTDGSLVWKCVGQGSAEKLAPAYYSPADCGPVVTDGKVFAPDRKWRMSVIDVVSGKLATFIDNVSAVALASDGSLYLRKYDNKNLAKIKPDGTQIWSTEISMEEAPVAPREIDGVVYATSKRGLLSALSAADGKILWQYQVTPSSYVYSSMSGDKSALFITGTDGSLTAFAP